ncbi:MAG: GNAT family N-acetyltransferase [Actinobacteria bacterium]|nr:GNAT family N-acetyltransferase [Actinomycetota bacterium]
MIAEFVKPNDARWSRILRETRHDFYHLPEYIEFAAKHEGGEPVVFYAEYGDDVFLAPLLLRGIPTELGRAHGLRDAATSYGYPSPILKSENRPASLLRFLRAFAQCAVEERIVTAFIRLHPMLSLPIDGLEKYGALFRHGQTVYIDLTLPSEQIWSQVRRDHRANLRKLDKSGFEAVMDDWDLYKPFMQLYRANMNRKDASDFYMFSDDYFQDLRESLGGGLHLCAVLSPAGDVAAAGLFVVTNKIVQFHLSGTADGYLKQAPAKMMLDHVWRWAKEAGNEVFHLGGGVGGNDDSLFKFKAGFSDCRADFYTYRMVLDKQKYGMLMNEHAEEFADSSNGDPHFFPGYRKPMGTRGFGEPTLEGAVSS